MSALPSELPDRGWPDCQALEDSAVLAAELAGAGAAGRPYSEGLARYAAVRAPRAIRVQRTARTWGEIWHVGGVAKLIRDELLLTRDVADHRHVSWLFGHSVFGPGSSELKAGPEAVPPGDTTPAGPRN